MCGTEDSGVTGAEEEGRGVERTTAACIPRTTGEGYVRMTLLCWLSTKKNHTIGGVGDEQSLLAQLNMQYWEIQVEKRKNLFH